MSSATETIEGFVKSDYKYGFITDIEAESAPPGLNEDIIRFYLSQEKRARLHAGVASQSLPALAHHAAAHVAQGKLPSG